jgi:hypothetical protein
MLYLALFASAAHPALITSRQSHKSMAEQAVQPNAVMSQEQRNVMYLHLYMSEQ